MNRKNLLIALTSLTATYIALTAAFFSVSGIAKLFAGATIGAVVMASALELGKIVGISFLYQYWKEIPKVLKHYMTVASVVLMIITSLGIYGYLTAAYAKVAATPLQLNADIQSVSNQVTSIEQDIKRKNDRLNQLIQLRNQQENRLDQLITKSSSGNNSMIRTVQTALNSADKNVQDIQKELTSLAVKRDSLNSINISKQVEIETNSDIGTFVYIAKTFNVELDTVVKWFTLIIVLVFDPLAIALVIAVNFLLRKDDVRLPDPIPVVEEKEPYSVYVPPPDPTTSTLAGTSPEQVPEVKQYINEDDIKPLLDKWWAKRNGRG